MSIENHRAGRHGGAPVALIIVILVAILLVAAIFITRGSKPVGPVDPPAIELASLEPALARRLESRLAAVDAAQASAEAWGDLGISFDVHEYYDEAIVCYEQAAALDDDEYLWPYLLGNCRRLGDRKAALANFRRAVALNDGLASAHYEIGYLLLQDGKLDDAEAAFEHALSRDDTLIVGQLGLAKIALERDDSAGAAVALEHLQRAVELGPRTNEVHFLLAEAYRRIGDEGKSRTHATIAGLDWQPEPAFDPDLESRRWEEGVTLDWRRRRSRRHAERGELAQFVAEWEAAMEEDPLSPVPYMELAEAYLVVNKMNEALEALDRAVERDPDNARIQLGRANALARLRRIDDAIVAAELALELDPELYEAQSNLGGLLIRVDRTEEGLDYLRRAAEAMPNNADARFNLAMGLKRTEQPVEAEQAFLAVVAIDPSRMRARFEAGMLAAIGKRYEEAGEQLEVVVASDEPPAGAFVNLGQVHLALDRPAEAAATFKAGLEHFPDDIGLMRSYAWLLATSGDDQVRAGSEAVFLAKRLCGRSSYQNAYDLDILGAACAERGDFEPARAYASDAVEIMSSRPTTPETEEAHNGLMRAMQDRLEMYFLEQPYRVPGPTPGPTSKPTPQPTPKPDAP